MLATTKLDFQCGRHDHSLARPFLRYSSTVTYLLVLFQIISIALSFTCNECAGTIALRLAVAGLKKPSFSRHYDNKTTCPSSSSSTISSSLSRRDVLTSSSAALLSMTSSSTTSSAADIADKSSNTGLYWNRELGTKSTFDESSPIIQHARIACLSNPDDPNIRPLYGTLPEGCEILHIGINDINIPALKEARCNTIFVSEGKLAREPLSRLIIELGSDLKWIHSRSAGIDAFYSDTIAQDYEGIMTNAKGQFSSTLAEYTIGACFYFAKDLPRLLRQKENKVWDPYPILELRGATLGIVGFGDIGQAAGRLAASLGMKIIALTRQPRTSSTELLEQFPNKNNVRLLYSSTSPNALNTVFAESDYVLIATPLTKETYKMIGTEQFKVAKNGSVLINVGRGPVIDEEALIRTLEEYPNNNSRLKGAALDVTMIEPLPIDSPLWTLENVLLSPHNMDMTTTFMLESTEFYVKEQLPRFVRGLPLLNPVNTKEGY